ncbi:sulfatase-like hydrolase/transferase [Maribellus comscasis]|uniref:Sulfatase-like hydrolase/transferase n=1 Tax=Maribellus comscasis TaxID=2681766 RepID=A0A6I6JUK1_9BACT|nr:sulfatase [Maribellus comscasis]QGY46795.1 sulfatase-like hydrolase/transferase [Maribellus comscasis]
MKKTYLLFIFIAALSSNLFAGNKSTPPNIILIFCDDLGYADLSSYGSLWNQTPEVDQMAVEGVRFTDFYAGAPVCSPSRAGLMTGCYARRVDLDLDQNNAWVLFPKAKKGINPEETILPEALKKAGYSTAIIGKWHLGDQPEFLPINHGFDYWFGLPYSNDMGIEKENIPLLPIMQNEKVIGVINQKSESEMSTLTERYTEEALNWIGKNKKKPFFIYLAHTMPHNPVAARKQFHRKTNNLKKGFGASVAEISWSTGEILNYLKQEGLAKNTLVIFTSDNGGQPYWGASNGILKGNKGQTFEGGIRVPCIAWWPGRIKPGTTCNSPASVLDFYSTFTALANLNINDSIKRDGTDISDYLFNPAKIREDRPFFYWHVGYLQAVRYGDWKLNLLGQFSKEEQQNILKSTYGHTVFPDNIELYNLRSDPGEKTNVADKNPEIVAQIQKLAEKEISALGEWTDKGPEVRKTIYIDSPEILLK